MCSVPIRECQIRTEIVLREMYFSDFPPGLSGAGGSFPPLYGGMAAAQAAAAAHHHHHPGPTETLYRHDLHQGYPAPPPPRYHHDMWHPDQEQNE